MAKRLSSRTNRTEKTTFQREASVGTIERWQSALESGNVADEIELELPETDEES